MKYLTMLFLLLISQSVLANSCIDLVQSKDFYEAADICSSMAEKGDRDAQFALAVMYYQGNGVMSDMSKAQKWMREAAQKNHNQAQYNLGIMRANGRGGSADLVEAYAWLKISEDNGYSAAADSVSQLGSELSSGEKKSALEKIKAIKDEFKLE